MLTDDLIALGAPAITREDRVRAFERLRVPVSATLEPRHGHSARPARWRRGVAVVGSVEVKGQDLIVRARSIRIDAGRMSPEIVESGPLAEHLRRSMGVWRASSRPTPRCRPRTWSRGTRRSRRSSSTSRGCWSHAPASKISFLSQALRIEPAFHRARIELWNAYTDLSEHQQALAAVRDVPSHIGSRGRRGFLAPSRCCNLAQYQPAFTALTELNTARSGSGDSEQSRHRAVAADAGRGPGECRHVFPRGDAGRQHRLGPVLQSGLRLLARRRTWPTPSTGCAKRSAAIPADDAAHYVLGVALQASGSRHGSGAREGAGEAVVVGLRGMGSEAGRSKTTCRAASNASRPTSTCRRHCASKTSSSRPSSGTSATWPGFISRPGRRAYQAERDGEAIVGAAAGRLSGPVPDSAAHLLLGRVYLRGGRTDEAIDEFKIAIWSDDTVGAHLALAEAYVQAKDFAAARSRAAVDPQGRSRRTPKRKRMLDRLRT